MAKAIVVAGVQSRQLYLTTNNRLRQAIGASQLMDDAIRDLPNYGGRPVYVGGGNAAVIYDAQDLARKALGEWSLKWLEKAPGIRLVAGLQEADAKGWARNWQCARMEKLFAVEERGAFGCELLALSVTAYCPDTGLAAQRYDHYHRTWKSSEAFEKQEQSKRDRLHKAPETELEKLLHAEIVSTGYRFPDDLAELGMPDSSRQIAIVHCDGNGMGELFEDIVRELGESPSEDDFVGRVGRHSAACSEATNKALVNTFRDMRDRIEAWREAKVLKPRARGADNFFPARLLVSAGDDATWICAGRLGIGSAIRFCRHFEAATARILGKPRTACAGVAIVPLGFPFRRAYEIAADLCDNAKMARKKEGRNEGPADQSLVDIHAMTEGLTGEITDVRERYYRACIFRDPGPNTHADSHRPLNLSDDSLNSWNHFERTWRALQSGEQPWPRSRIKRLLEELSLSQERGQECAELFKSQAYPLPEKVENCFDVLELFDFHVEWPEVTKVGA